jgi:8-oxo-dGTP pyrophosphatase MutT (NUDIX family)
MGVLSWYERWIELSSAEQSEEMRVRVASERKESSVCYFLFGASGNRKQSDCLLSTRTTDRPLETSELFWRFLLYNNHMRVVGCFLEYDRKFVLVHRLPHKPDGDTWGLPSGKVEVNESDLDALRRELHEETGYKVQNEEIELLGEHDFVSPRGDTVTYVSYRVKLTKPHKVIVEEAAHSEYKWVSAEEADARDDLIHGLHELFRLVGFIK